MSTSILSAQCDKSPSRKGECANGESRHVFLSVVCDSYVARASEASSLEGCGVFRCGCTEFVGTRCSSPAQLSQRCVGCHHGAMYHNKPTRSSKTASQRLGSSSRPPQVAGGATPPLVGGVGNDATNWRSSSTPFADPEAPINRSTASTTSSSVQPKPHEEARSQGSNATSDTSLLLRREAMEAIREAEQTERIIRMKLSKAAHLLEFGGPSLQHAFSLALHTLETLGNLRSRLEEGEVQLRADVLAVMRRFMTLCEDVQKRVAGGVPSACEGTAEYPPKVSTAIAATSEPTGARPGERREVVAPGMIDEAVCCHCGEQIAWRASFCSACGARVV